MFFYTFVELVLQIIFFTGTTSPSRKSGFCRGSGSGAVSRSRTEHLGFSSHQKNVISRYISSNNNNITTTYNNQIFLS